MKIDLHGHRAVISGSTAGIGFAIAKGLAEAGAAVVINGRGEGAVKEAVRQLVETLAGASVEGIAADLATSDGVTQFLRRAGNGDILVNNLGIFEPRPFEQITDADWHRFFETNVMSGIRLSRHFLPAMREKNWGRVVFISSESALNIPTDDGRHRRHGECGPPRPDAIEGSCRLFSRHGQGRRPAGGYDRE